MTETDANDISYAMARAAAELTAARSIARDAGDVVLATALKAARAAIYAIPDPADDTPTPDPGTMERMRATLKSRVQAKLAARTVPTHPALEYDPETLDGVTGPLPGWAK